MRVVRHFCDACGKEIDASPANMYIRVTKPVGLHGKAPIQIKVVQTDGTTMEFCDRCKEAIESVFVGDILVPDESGEWIEVPDGNED